MGGGVLQKLCFWDPKEFSFPFSHYKMTEVVYMYETLNLFRDFSSFTSISIKNLVSASYGKFACIATKFALLYITV